MYSGPLACRQTVSGVTLIFMRLYDIVRKGQHFKSSELKYLLLVPVYAFYTFEVTVNFHNSVVVVTDKHTILNFIRMYLNL